MKVSELRIRAWIVPSLYATTAVAAGLLLPRLEALMFPDLTARTSVQVAMTMYSAIASGMIALTGIVFSITFVMVQFSATAYSPRLASLMTQDRFLAHALGMFIATFVYALAALAWLDRVSVARVPKASAWLVIGLLLASMGMFITLIERVGMLQVTRMLTFTATQGRRVIATTYPSIEASSSSAPPSDFREEPTSQTLLYHGAPRVIQSIDSAQFVAIATKHNVLIDVVASVGDVVVELTPLLHVLKGSETIDERRLLKAINLGEQRTFEQDPKYAIRLLVDIAIKALSPAINDPTTATQALDQIGDLLVRLGFRRIEIGTYRDGAGEVRLMVQYPTWHDFLRLSFDEICHYGADSVQVMRRMRALVSDLISILPEERRPALTYWQHRLQETITRTFSDADEQAEASVEDRQGLGTTRRRAAPRVDEASAEQMNTRLTA